MAEPLISICIPTYNGARFLQACLDSCTVQTFRDFEVVICDDGSMDETINIAQQYAGAHAYIKLHQNVRNLGLVGNWNRCIDLASGKWIKFLFQDDLMQPDCLQRFAAHFSEKNTVLTCRRNFVLEDPKLHQVDYYRRGVRTLENTGHYRSNNFSAATIAQIAAENIALNFIAEPSLTVFKKEAVTRLGYFDAELKQICDLEFFLRLASNDGLTYIPEKLCEFRIHAHSTTEKNLSSKDYHHFHLESLIFAAKLLAGPQFLKLRRSLSFIKLAKIRLYVKYKSYLAFKAIATDADRRLYNMALEKYRPFFFKPADVFYLWPLAHLKS